MPNRDIIVMGASAGGLSAFSRIIKQLPEQLNAAIFIVWHLSPYSNSMLPEILNRAGKLKAKHPNDGEPIEIGKIYIAPPDHHLLLESGRIRLTKGPKENRFRLPSTRCLGPRPTLMDLVSSALSSPARWMTARPGSGRSRTAAA